MLRASRWLVAALAAVFSAGVARADSVGFTAYFTGSGIALENDSALAEILEYSITIGDPAFNFDSAATTFTVGGPGHTFALVSPDTVDD
jgi:hypothetical protein